MLIADINIVCVTIGSQVSLAQGNASKQIHMSFICMVESLCCVPETIATLLISYSPK